MASTNTHLNPSQGSRWSHWVAPIGTAPYALWGTETVPVSGTIYYSSIFVDTDIVAVGAGFLKGSAVNTAKRALVGLWTRHGKLLASSTSSGTLVTAGTNALMFISFTASLDVLAGRYYVGVQFNDTTNTFRTIPANTYQDVATGSLAGVAGTITDIASVTTYAFSADTGPLAYISG